MTTRKADMDHGNMRPNMAREDYARYVRRKAGYERLREIGEVVYDDEVAREVIPGGYQKRAVRHDDD